MRTVASVICFCLLAVTGFCFSNPVENKSLPKKITLIFHHQTGKEELVLGNPVKNILGENIVIRKFKYYVSNFSVTGPDGKTTHLPVQYFLVDEADPVSKKITLTVPDIPINSIRFLLGVDSLRNVSGVQTGALDPLNGMFWTWNTGYIMAKLEGESEEAATAGHRFTYHIGGFRTGMNTARIIELPVKSRETNIHVTADINRWFKSSTEVRIAETPVCHTPGALAMKIADNYRNLFSIR